jgi:hypothetical protein
MHITTPVRPALNLTFGVLAFFAVSSVAGTASAQETAPLLDVDVIPGCVDLVYEAKEVKKIADVHTFSSIVGALERLSDEISRDGQRHQLADFTAQGYTVNGRSATRTIELRRRATFRFCIGPKRGGLVAIPTWSLVLTSKVTNLTLELSLGGADAANLVNQKTVDEVARSKPDFEKEVDAVIAALKAQVNDKLDPLTPDEVVKGLMTRQGITKPVKFSFDGNEYTTNYRVRSKIG